MKKVGLIITMLMPFCLQKKDVEQIVGSKEITEPDLRRKHYIVSLVNSLAHHPANNVNKAIADAASELVSATEKLISCSKKVLGELGWRKDFHEYFGYIVPNPMTTPETVVSRFLPIVDKHLNRKAVVRNWLYVVYNLLERTRWEFADMKAKVRETPSAKDILAEVEDVKTSLENAARNLESNLFCELSIKAFDIVNPVNLPQKASDFIGFINRLP